jgi:hypothetical protein
VPHGDAPPLDDERDAPIATGELEEPRHGGGILLHVEVLDLEPSRAVLDPSGVRVGSGMLPEDLHGVGHGFPLSR